jgi:hypothetical protein
MGCADAISQYLFMLEWIENRSEETLRVILTTMGEQFEEVKVVITDGLQAYKSLIPDTFEQAVHLLCAVHAFRIILREQDEIERKANTAYIKWKEFKTELAAARSKIYAKRQKIHRRQQMLAQWNLKQKEYHVSHGIKKSAKHTEWTPQRLRIKAHLNELRVLIRSQEKTLNGTDHEISQRCASMAKAYTDYLQKKRDAMQSGRLVGVFKALLQSSAWDYPLLKAKFERRLERNTYSIATKLRKFLKDHPEMFATKTPYLAAIFPLSMSNTNIIEGIFGRIRPILKKARRFHPTPITTALFDIVRLRYNLTPPYSGPNRCISPLERAGIHPHYRDYLDALWPPTRKIDRMCFTLYNPCKNQKSRQKRFSAWTKSILNSNTALRLNSAVV